ncbi:protein phosphatase 2C 51-like [Aristolochia californica]|uniref:protein phosphatase 2C 51-like n=1 Tax=Aristolochia californica TaxID=171875 RepID=UPI0035E3B8CE
MESVSLKRTRAARRKRLEILPLRSKTRGSDGLIREKDGRKSKRKRDGRVRLTDGFDAAEVSLSLSVESSSSSPDISDTPKKNIPIGILLSRGKILDDEDDARNISCRAHGAVSICGRRRAMEDAVTVARGLVSCGKESGSQYDFFGVYDGHGGCQVAHVCRDRLHVVLAKQVKDCCGEAKGVDGVDWKEVMETGFAILDGEIGKSVSEGQENGMMDTSMKTVGSTVVVGLVGTETLIVANCGDSRAVMSRGGVVVPLSCDHKPDRPDEMERVEAAGGRVINWDGHRVLGVLATSRSIGDHYLKPYVISEPEVTITERTVEDEFLILASDGLWDVVSNEKACEVVRKRLVRNPVPKKLKVGTDDGDGSAEAAAMLVELALGRGSNDNISVIVIDLRKASKL